MQNPWDNFVQLSGQVGNLSVCEFLYKNCPVADCALCRVYFFHKAMIPWEKPYLSTEMALPYLLLLFLNINL